MIPGGAAGPFFPRLRRGLDRALAPRDLRFALLTGLLPRGVLLLPLAVLPLLEGAVLLHLPALDLLDGNIARRVFELRSVLPLDGVPLPRLALLEFLTLPLVPRMLLDEPPLRLAALSLVLLGEDAALLLLFLLLLDEPPLRLAALSLVLLGEDAALLLLFLLRLDVAFCRVLALSLLLFGELPPRLAVAPHLAASLPVPGLGPESGGRRRSSTRFLPRECPASRGGPIGALTGRGPEDGDLAASNPRVAGGLDRIHFDGPCAGHLAAGQSLDLLDAQSAVHDPAPGCAVAREPR